MIRGKLGLKMGLGLSGAAAKQVYPRVVGRSLHAGTPRAVQYTFSRAPWINDTGKTINRLQLPFTNWTYNASIEYSIPTNTIFRVSVEYGGQLFFGYTTIGGATRDLNLASGADGDLFVDGLNIPDGALFYVRAWSNHAAANNNPTGYANNAFLNGYQIKSYGGTDSTDYTSTLSTPAYNTGTAVGAFAVISLSTENPSEMYALTGDSITRGNVSGISVSEGAIAMSDYSFLNLSFSGAAVSSQANISKRLTLAKRLGCNRLITNFPVNDLQSGRTVSQIQTDFNAFYQRIKTTHGFKELIQLTCTPKTQTDINTPATTPTGAFTGGASSFRSLVNAWFRSIAGTSEKPDRIFEMSDIVEASRDSGTWKNSTYTGDFLHPSATACAEIYSKLANFIRPSKFNPSQLSGLNLWIDAADIYSIIGTSGAVSSMIDKSGQAQSATQGTGANQPSMYNKTMNAKISLDFDGTNDNLSLTATTRTLLQNAENTVFAVYKSDNTSANRQLLGVAQTGGKKWGVELDYPNNRLVFYSGLNSTNHAQGANAAAHIVAYTNSTTTLTPYVDGVAGSTTTTTFENGNTAGAIAFMGDSYFDGAFSELIIFNRVLTSAEMNQVGQYLSTKWGISWTNI